MPDPSSFPFDPANFRLSDFFTSLLDDQPPAAAANPPSSGEAITMDELVRRLRATVESAGGRIEEVNLGALRDHRAHRPHQDGKSYRDAKHFLKGVNQALDGDADALWSVLEKLSRLTPDTAESLSLDVTRHNLTLAQSLYARAAAQLELDTAAFAEKIRTEAPHNRAAVARHLLVSAAKDPALAREQRLVQLARDNVEMLKGTWELHQAVRAQAQFESDLRDRLLMAKSLELSHPDAAAAIAAIVAKDREWLDHAND